MVLGVNSLDFSKSDVAAVGGWTQAPACALLCLRHLGMWFVDLNHHMVALPDFQE